MGDLHWLARAVADVPAGTGWLGPWEAERVAGMRFAKRRSEFLASRLAAKHAVRAAVDPEVALAAVEVRQAPGGAPVLHVNGRPSDLAISLTDRADWAVCLLGPAGSAIGCDLELVEPRSARFVADWLTPAEQRTVKAPATGEVADLVANLVWSAKESALKVLRTGLRRDTRSVEVHVATGDVAAGVWHPLEVRAEEGAVFPGWWRRDGAFVLTVAADVAMAPPAPLEPDPLGAAVASHAWLQDPAGGSSA